MIPFMKETDYQVEADLSKKERDLAEKIRKGFQAEETMSRLGWVFDDLEKAVVDKFKSIDPINYQKFDNTQYFMLSLKLKVIEEIRSILGCASTNGSIAQEDLRDLQGGHNGR